MRMLATAAVVAVVTGCAPCELGRDGIGPVAGGPEFETCVQVACQQAVLYLNEVNEQIAELPGGRTVQIDDYDVTAEPDSYDGRSLYSFSDRIRAPLPWRGTGNHFAIWVYRDNYDVEVFAGR